MNINLPISINLPPMPDPSDFRDMSDCWAINVWEYKDALEAWEQSVKTIAESVKLRKAEGSSQIVINIPSMPVPSDFRKISLTWYADVWLYKDALEAWKRSSKNIATAIK